MSGLGMGGSALLKVKPGDYERAMALMVEVGGDKGTRKYLQELVTASAVHDKAREEAEAAAAEAKRRDALAQEAEDSARSEISDLATETAETDTRLRRERAALAAERQRLEELGKQLETTETDINMREGALKRAFHAYTEE